MAIERIKEFCAKLHGEPLRQARLLQYADVFAQVRIESIRRQHRWCRSEEASRVRIIRCISRIGRIRYRRMFEERRRSECRWVEYPRRCARCTARCDYRRTRQVRTQCSVVAHQIEPR